MITVIINIPIKFEITSFTSFLLMLTNFFIVFL